MFQSLRRVARPSPSFQHICWTVSLVAATGGAGPALPGEARVPETLNSAAGNS